MTYNEFIQNILDTRGRFGIPDGEYKERHHIMPKCMGGTNDEENLIDLYAQEHFVAHQLIANENPSCNALHYALWNMSNVIGATGERYKLTPEEYENIRKNISKKFSGVNNPMYGKRSPMYGKHHSKETKEKMRNRALGRKMSEEFKLAASEYWIGKRKGENNPMYGRRGGDNPKAKPVLQFNIDGTFLRRWESAKDVQKELGIKAPNIVDCCNHKKYHKTAGGFIWRYSEEGE